MPEKDLQGGVAKNLRRVYDAAIMTFDDLKDRYGDNDVAIAAALGTTRQLVSHWRKKGISPARQAWIQIQTRGRLKADMPREQTDGQAA
jgi:hypothetical protein